MNMCVGVPQLKEKFKNHPTKFGCEWMTEDAKGVIYLSWVNSSRDAAMRRKRKDWWGFVQRAMGITGELYPFKGFPFAFG